MENEQKYLPNKKHKHFNVGDVVTDGKQIGIVKCTENKFFGYNYEDGYMGIIMITGEKKYLVTVKRDKWKKVDDPYYSNIYKIDIELTGKEIEEMKKYTIQNWNEELKAKILNSLNNPNKVS